MSSSTSPMQAFFQLNLRFIQQYHLHHSYSEYDHANVPTTLLYKTVADYECELRGFRVEKQGNNYFLFFRGQQLIGGRRGMFYSTVSTPAMGICGDKHLTKWALQTAGLPIVKGFNYGSSDLDAALLEVEAEQLWPLVVKPSNLVGGKGVQLGIANAVEFKQAWADVLAAKKKADRAHTGKVIVERMHLGLDLRVVVIDGKAACAMVRVPAHVYADGEQNLAQLIEQKNQLRRQNPHHQRFLIDTNSTAVHALLEYQGYSMSCIPPKGEIVFLGKTANISAAGDGLDVTGDVCDDILALAEHASRAIPGLGAVAVDFLTPSLDVADDAVILELNADANYRIHYFPMMGVSHQPVGLILDSMVKAVREQKGIIS